ncbi:MAG TPA: 3' terminal RNA ribose 2'-O-methyltransferase Hen1 [Pseudonocardiaceae bacterium]|nr:3' terminal RNA ribose 2'-O-methyltransferase Hen1 [Pseudonocardiaceae bacterium]
MLLTITLTGPSATDLGYLLYKHPARVQPFDVSVGTAHVFYPEATGERCTAALLLEIDPIGLVRGRRGAAVEGFTLGQYVNDRPYAASSMLSVAIGRVFKTAMHGRSEARPELAATALPLELHVPALPCRGGAELATRLFAPLGWTVDAKPIPLDETVPEWGDSRYVDLRLTGTIRLADALNHLYVLLPVLDDAKHYWVTQDEVDKLIRVGGGWLAEHPDKELISRRYLAHQGRLTSSALDRLADIDDTEPDALDATEPGETAVGAGPRQGVGNDTVSLARQRRGAVLAALRASGARRVGDLGCGEGALVAELLADNQFTHVVATDVSSRALEIAERKLRVDRMPPARRERLSLLQSSLTYRDGRLAGLDAVVLMEVIEHVDPPRLPALARTVFDSIAPETVVVTTPNVEYNVRYPALLPGNRRHRDHRFEWTRAEFADWAGGVADDWGYQVRYLPVGDVDPELGPPTQLALFTRKATAA